MKISKPIRSLIVAAALASLVALSGCATRRAYGYGSYGTQGYGDPYYYDQPYHYRQPAYQGYYAPAGRYAYPRHYGGRGYYDAGRYVAPRGPAYAPPARVAPYRGGGVRVTPPRGYHRPRR